MRFGPHPVRAAADDRRQVSFHITAQARQDLLGFGAFTRVGQAQGLGGHEERVGPSILRTLGIQPLLDHGANDLGSSRLAIMREVELSLSRLGTYYIDL